MINSLPKELEGTNYQFIKELEEKLEEKISNEITRETIRNKIIFLTTLIGSYEARANYKSKTEPPRPIQDFELGRITTKIFEAGYIANVRKDLLKLFSKNSPDTILKKLYQIRATLDDKNIPKEGLYPDFAS